MKNIIKDKKIITIIVASILVIISIILLIKYGVKDKVKISKAEVNELKLVNYEHANFTMQIPEGWTVETGGVDMFFAIRVYNPSDDRYQIFAILKAEPFLKNEQAKSWYENYYNAFGGDGNKVLAKALVLDGTVGSFYSRFNEYTAYTKEVDTMYDSFNFPDLKNFTVVESFENNSSMKSVSKDDKVLRGTFQDSKTGKNGEGLFMGTLIDPGSYMALGYDTLFYTLYNVMGITAGEYDLINYQELLTKSLNSLIYKESFTNQTIQNGNERTKTALSINASIQEAFDSYNNAWTSRQTTYDITSQKYSDSTLGYERVYDTDTGEIYKAYNGFTDDYDGERYKPITDDMYTESIDGYIEK